MCRGERIGTQLAHGPLVGATVSAGGSAFKIFGRAAAAVIEHHDRKAGSATVRNRAFPLKSGTRGPSRAASRPSAASSHIVREAIPTISVYMIPADKKHIFGPLA